MGTKKIEANMEMVEALLKLSNDVKELSHNLEEDQNKLKRTFNQVRDGLGVHEADFESWVNQTITVSDRNSRAALQELQKQLLLLAKRIANYVRNGTSGGNSTGATGRPATTAGGIPAARASPRFRVATEKKSYMIRSAHTVLPDSNVSWQGERGNSICCLRRDAVIQYHGRTVTGAELSRAYGKNGAGISIPYKHGEPDFSAYADRRVGAVNVPNFSSSRQANFAAANTVLAEKLNLGSVSAATAWMRQQNLTWHECGDRKTMIAVPTPLHSAFRHTGGISVQQQIDLAKEKLAGRNVTLYGGLPSCCVGRERSVSGGRRR